MRTLDLNCSTDDFDLVTADDGSVVFTALDRTERTDTWFSNEQELGPAQGCATRTPMTMA